MAGGVEVVGDAVPQPGVRREAVHEQHRPASAPGPAADVQRHAVLDRDVLADVGSSERHRHPLDARSRAPRSANATDTSGGPFDGAHPRPPAQKWSPMPRPPPPPTPLTPAGG